MTHTISKIKKFLTEKGYDCQTSAGYLHKSANCSFYCITAEKNYKTYSFIFAVSNDPKKTSFSMYKEIETNA